MNVSGELDALTPAELTEGVAPHLPGVGHVVLDLTEVTFLASSGLRALLAVNAAAAAQGTRLHLTGVEHPAVRRPLEVTQLLGAFAVCAHPQDVVTDP